MFKAIGFFLRLPWQALLGIAVALCAIGYDAYDNAKYYERQKAEALAAGMPPAVPLDRFTLEDKHPAGEVHVEAWLNTDYNYELTLQKRGADEVRRMFVLFGPGDSPESKVVRAVVVIDPSYMDAFMEVLLAGVTDYSDPRMPFTMNGSYRGSPDLADMVDDALAEKGLQKDAEFFALEPYFEGREAALAPDPGAPREALNLFLVLALVCVILAMKNYRQVRQEPVRRSLAEVEIPPVGAPIDGFAPVARPLAAPQVAVPPPPPASGDWSPLEAVKAKQMQRQEAVAPARSDGWESPIKSAKPGSKWRTAVTVLAVIPVFGFASMLLDQNALPFAGSGMGSGEVSAGQGTAPDVAEVQEAPVADAAAEVVAQAPVVEEAAPPVPEEEGKGIYWAPTGYGEHALYLVLTLLAAAVLKVGLSLRGGRAKAAAGRDPWDRLSERLR